jgi:hypothetical protein
LRVWPCGSMTSGLMFWTDLASDLASAAPHPGAILNFASDLASDLASAAPHPVRGAPQSELDALP